MDQIEHAVNSKTVVRHVLAVILALVLVTPLKAQTLELLGGDLLNGAVNGVALGGATMAIQNTESFEPVRIGLGGGILYGLGMGIYDVTQVSKGEYFYISGTFNDGTNSTILILLDTVYGAAMGTVVAASYSLLSQRPVLDGLRYGAGIGAWTGFGFGLVDVFILAEGPGDFQETGDNGGDTADGLVSYRSATDRMSIGLLSPALITQKKLTASGLAITAHPAVNLLNLKLNF